MHLVNVSREIGDSEGGFFLAPGEYYAFDNNAAELLQVGGENNVRLFAKIPPPRPALIEEMDLKNHSVLFVRPGGLGDLLWLTPIWASMRLRWPGVRIGMCAFKNILPIIRGSVDFTELYPLEVSATDGRTVVWLEGAPEEDPAWGRESPISIFARWTGVPPLGTTPRYIPDKISLERADSFWAGVPFGSRIALQLVTSQAHKNFTQVWMERLLLELFNLGGPGLTVFLMGGTEIENFPSHPRIRNASHLGFHIEESAAILSKSAVLIGGDSVGLHLAAAMGVPAVGLFGPFSGRIYGNGYPKMATIQGPRRCSPCNHHRGPGRPWPEGGPCVEAGLCVALDAIDPRTVALKAVKQIERYAKNIQTPTEENPTP